MFFRLSVECFGFDDPFIHFVNFLLSLAVVSNFPKNFIDQFS